MSCTQLYTYPTYKFGGFDDVKDAKYAILGVPFDFTSTYRPGSRFGPAAIREASINLETYCFRNDRDVENVRIRDIGDLEVLNDTDETLHRLRLVLKEIVDAQQTPIVLGGEHTVTHGCIQAFQNTGIITFDAHLDLRNEYLGNRLSHATFMRRVCERIGADKIVEVGIRAVCREELNYAEKTRLKYVTSLDVGNRGIGEVVQELQDWVKHFSQIYVSIDMDVLDPAFAPGVGNPVPEGLSPTTLLELLRGICDRRVVGVDVVEVAPHYDFGVTALQAAHVIFNVMSFLTESAP
jgi:agmatinase